MSSEASKRGRANRNKGANYEREISKLFETYFPQLDLKRTPMSGGFSKSSNNEEIKGDISNLNKEYSFNLHLECKNQKNIAILKWFSQANEDCSSSRVPAVVFKQQQKIENGKIVQKKDDFICIRLEDFLNIISGKIQCIEKK